ARSPLVWRLVMRMAGWVALATVTLAAPAWSQEVYRWQDDAGQVHYSNTPAAAPDGAPVPDDPMRFRGATPEPAAPEATDAALQPRDDAAAAAPDEDPLGAVEDPTAPKLVTEDEAPGVSTDASLRRNDLERDLRATQKRIAQIDGQLHTLSVQ